MDDYGNELYLTANEHYQSMISVGCYGGYGVIGYLGYYSTMAYV